MNIVHTARQLAARGYNKAKNFAGQSVAVIGTTFGVSAANASTDPFDAALASATSAVTSYAGDLVTLGAVAVVFMIGLKYVKKIVKAS